MVSGEGGDVPSPVDHTLEITRATAGHAGQRPTTATSATTSYYNKLSAMNNCLTHSGDNRDGAGEGYDESISIDLGEPRPTTNNNTPCAVVQTVRARADQPSRAAPCPTPPQTTCP